MRALRDGGGGGPRRGEREGRDDDVVEILLPIRRTFARFGGSHAQRDLPARMLLQAAIRSGHHELARALVDERLALRPTSTFAWNRLATLAATAGDTDAADMASATATLHQARFAAASRVL